MHIKVNIFDLLDTHWTLTQRIDESKLEAVSVGGVVIAFEFVNDGVNLWAYFSFSKPAAPKVVEALDANATKWITEGI